MWCRFFSILLLKGGCHPLRLPPTSNLGYSWQGLVKIMTKPNPASTVRKIITLSSVSNPGMKCQHSQKYCKIVITHGKSTQTIIVYVGIQKLKLCGLHGKAVAVKNELLLIDRGFKTKIYGIWDPVLIFFTFTHVPFCILWIFYVARWVHAPHGILSFWC